MRTPLRHLALTALVAALTACGTSDNANNYSSLVVFGDSLSDVGTHNVGTVAQLGAATGGAGRWTVNSVAAGEIWVERIASDLGLTKPCAAETGLLPNLPGLTGAAVTAHPGCTNYAQGSARITNPLGPSAYALQAAFNTQTLGLLAKPIQNQMDAHLAAAGGNFTGNELIMVLAGANDVFMETQLTAGAGNPTGAVTNVATAGATLGQLIKTKLIDKGARRVLVLNMPDVAGTPFLKAQSADTRTLVDTMVNAFNAQLAAQLAGVAQVHIGDLYTRSKDQGANPAKYGLTNTTTASCGANALGTTSLVCNASNVIAGDISHFAFADDVHPTPYGHQLIAQFANQELFAAGWH